MRTILHELSDAMSRGECAALVIGGYSMGAYGISRQTADIDLLVATPHSESLVAILVRAGYREAGRNALCARFVSDNLMHLPVDLLFVSEATWEKLWPASTPAVVEGAPVRVPSPLHLISLKLHAMKQDSSRVQDFSDIVLLLSIRRGEITQTELREACERFGPDGILPRILTALPQ